MPKSKTKIKRQMSRKTNLELVKTIIAAKKNKSWLKIAEILSGPRKKRRNTNLGEINKKIKGKEALIVPGKVLSQGEINNKKIKIIAMDFSEKAKEKLLKSGCKISTILEEIEKNPSAKGTKILKSRKIDLNQLNKESI